MAVNDFIVTCNMCETHKFIRQAYPNNYDDLTEFCDNFAAYLGKNTRRKSPESPNSNKWCGLNITNKYVHKGTGIYKYELGPRDDGQMDDVEGFCDITNYLQYISLSGNKSYKINCLSGMFQFMLLGGVVRIGTLDFTIYDYSEFVQEVDWTI